MLQLEAVVARCVDALATRASLQRSHARARARAFNEAPTCARRSRSSKTKSATTSGVVAGTQPAPAVVPPLAAASAAAAPPEVHAHTPPRPPAAPRERAAAAEDRIARDNADALTLCSIHAAKGLEWRHVFVARLNDGELPMVQGG